MKRMIAAIITCVFALTLAGCGLEENTRRPEVFMLPELNSEDSKTAGGVYKESQTQSEVQEPSESEVTPPEISEEPPNNDPVTTSGYVGNIHNWFPDDELYNINDKYEPTDRYYKAFEWLNSSAAVWNSKMNISPLNDKYDPEKALQYANAHWDDALDYCAPFVSRCFEAAGLSISSNSSTALLFMLIHSGLGFGQFIPMNDDGTVTLPPYAKPGDFVGIYCHREGLMVHSVLYAGNDENGSMRAYAHNPADGAEGTFRYRDSCKSCEGEFREAFFFHFYGDGDTRVDEGVLLTDSSGYVIPEQSYDRGSAVSYAGAEPIIDGLGEHGAEQTSAALRAGGLDIDTHIQAAVFVMLLKSRLGEVYSLPVNTDRTVTLPDFAEEGDVCFLYCSDEALIYSSFIVKGRDEDGKLLGYTRDRLNNENTAFRVENVCPSSICSGEITEVLVFHFNG